MSDWQMPLLAVAYGTDLVIGDPYWFPHPVRAMGWVITWGEHWLRRVIPWERLAGALLVVIIVGASIAAAAGLMHLALRHNLRWGFVVAAALLWTCLSTRDLARESQAVRAALDANDLPLARVRVARIVGRDTAELTSPEIVRATVETIAESTLDGILSPLFYFVVGGVPAAIAYKAINTLDSMIGHRSARYIRFGWAAATVDTWANWVPARWSAFVFAAAAPLRGYSARAAWRYAWREGGEGTVPNAGIPEAAMAGALGVQLGGMNRYLGREAPMPLMGTPQRPLDAVRIREAVGLMYAASVVACLMAMAALWLKAQW